MITHTFFNKCNTIIENSEYNTGLNPVAELNAGKTLSRILIDFDVNSLRKKVLDGEIETKNLKHIVKMTNCGNVNLPYFNEDIFISCGVKKRAASFDVIAFKLPFSWDEGRGYDYHGDYAKESHAITSKDCSNWFQARNGMEWDEDGVYFNNTLNNDYNENYNKNNNGIIVGKQHFDNGTENLEIDITEYLNFVLEGKEEFYGIGLAFLPRYEMETVEDRFISFFTNHTNTCFLPYLETINCETILDDRANFYIGNKNRLYFFVTDNGEYINLDFKPTCMIDGVEYEVKQNGKGSYYIEVAFKNGEVEPNSIMYDVWSNIILNGDRLDDVEMEFVVLPIEKKISMGKHNSNNINLVPQLSGINNKELVKIGEIREIFVDFVEEYSYGKKNIPLLSEYRVYIKENDREIDIFTYHPIERRYDEHSFIIDSNDLVPNTYHIDIRLKHGKSIKYFENMLEFDVVSNVTNFYK